MRPILFFICGILIPPLFDRALNSRPGEPAVAGTVSSPSARTIFRNIGFTVSCCKNATIRVAP
jgi:hypothetical protein